MPRRELSEAERYLREADDLRRREQQLSGMRDRAARELGLIVLDAGGASLPPERLRALIRDAVAIPRGTAAEPSTGSSGPRTRRSLERLPADSNGAGVHSESVAGQ